MSAPQTFRKNPVEIKAMQFDGSAERATEIIDWAIENDVTITYHCPDGEACRRDTHSLHVCTLEGTMTALPGDWIIRGVQGEFYPCKPDIFEATYTAVPESDPDPVRAAQLGVEAARLRLHEAEQKLSAARGAIA